MKQGKKTLKGALSLLLAIALCCSLVVPALAANTFAEKFPGEAVNDDRIGALRTWSDTGNILTDNGSYATVSALIAGNSQYLKARIFGFKDVIPADATITGIEVIINRYKAGADNITDNSVRLVDNNNNIVGTDHAKTGNWPSGSPAAVTYGSSTDTWGFTSAQLYNMITNDPTGRFGAVISVKLPGLWSTTAKVDSISMKVYYTKASTATTVTTSGTPSEYGTPVTFTATVTGASTGTVEFREGSTLLGSAALSGGTATYSTSSLSVGSHTITAAFIEDAAHQGSTGTVTQNVIKADSTTALVAAPTPSTYGQDVTLTATVTTGATGTVEFFNGSTSLGTVSLTGSAAQKVVSGLAADNYAITATYSGDSNYNGSTGTLAGGHTVSQASSSTSVSADKTSTHYGESVTFTATVTSAATGFTGSVDFYDGTALLGTSTLNAGAATLTTSTLTAVNHSITAVYSGDANFSGSTSDATSVTVAKTTPTITWTTPDAIAYGTALSDTQLNAVFTNPYTNAVIPGTADYSPTAGTVLNAGANQLLSVTFTPGDATNYTTQTGTNYITVNRVDPGITLDNLTATYDGSTHAASVTTTMPDAAQYVTLMYSSPIYPASFTPPTNAGSYTVSAVINTPNYYATVSGTLVISPADPGITFADTVHIYPGPATGATVTTTATIQPGTLFVTYEGTSYSGTVYTNSATAPTEAGSYSVIATVTDPNYADIKSESYTVNKATATITFGNTNPDYTGSAVPLDVTTSPAGLAVTVTYEGADETTYGPTTNAPTNAGDYTVTAEINDHNYQGTASTSYVIGTASPTIAISNTTQAYTGAPLPVTVTTSNPSLPAESIQVIYEGINILGIGTNYGPSETPPTNVGIYKVTATILDPNCVNSRGNPVKGYAVLTITPASATITLGNLTQTYDGSRKPVSVTTAPVDGISCNVLYTGDFTKGTHYGPSTTAPTNAGTYIVLATITDSNYIGLATGTLKINKAPVTFNVSGQSQAYDGSPIDVSVTVSNGQTATYSYTGRDGTVYGPTSAAPTNAGKYSLILTVNNANYYSQQTFDIEITQAALSLSVDDKTMVYGDPVPTLTVTASGLQGTDTLDSIGLSAQLVLNTTATSASGVGNYDITMSGPAETANYTVTYSTTPGVLTIGTRPVTVRAKDMSKTYGDPDPDPASFTYEITVGSLVNGDSLTGDLERVPGEVAGTYAITQGTLALSSNYALTFIPGTFTIDKAELTVTADNKTKTYGEDLPPLTYTFSGFQFGDDESVVSGTPVLECNADSSTSVSSSPVDITIEVTSLTAANYTFTGVDGELTINPKSITGMTIDPISSQLFTGSAITPDVTVSGLASGDFDVGYSNNVNPGTAAVEVTGKGNYTGTILTTFSIYIPYFYTTDNTVTAAGNINLRITTIGNRTTIAADLPGTTSASLEAAYMQAIIDAAQPFEEAGQLVIAELYVPEATSDTLAMTISGALLKNLADGTDAALKIGGPLGSLRFDPDALDSLVAQAGTAMATFNISKVPSATIAAQYPEYADKTVYDISVMAGSTKLTTFGGGEVTVTMPYTPAAGEDASNIVIYYLSADGAVMMQHCVYDAESGAVSFTTDHLSLFAVGYKSDAAFTDISGWYVDNVNYLAERGIMGGVGNGLFNPDGNITRGQFVKILANLAGADLSVYTASTFSDVKTTDWFFGAVEWAYANNIAKGTDGKFNPDASISRQDLAVMLMRYAELVDFTLPITADEMIFTDSDKIADYAVNAVTAMQRAGIISGTNGNFAPTSGATRAQAAKMVATFMQAMINF